LEGHSAVFVVVDRDAMKTGRPIRLRAFIGFQIQSEYHTVAQMEHLVGALATRLLERHNVQLVHRFGIFPAGGILWDEVTDAIRHSDISIFDISENNPNVLIELGLAVGFGRQVFLLKSTRSDHVKRPSDLAWIYVPYESGDALSHEGSVSELERGILAYLRKTHRSDYFVRSVWGFEEHDTVTVICSELDDPELRQHPEPNEFIYLNKYGDVDSLLEVLVTIHRLYPNVRVEYFTANEILEMRSRFTGHLVVIGGPDYNAVSKWFDHLCPFEYVTGDGQGNISIREKRSGEMHQPIVEKKEGRFQILDYGFFIKRLNPYNPDKKVIMIGGPHTYGVFGAVRAFSYWGEDKDEPSYQNCRDVVTELGDDPQFSALFEVHAMENSVLTPRLDRAHLQSLEPASQSGASTGPSPRVHGKPGEREDPEA
jgi:hypothetical protein